jgi:Icc-related predicted phosphoesterase
MNYPEAYKGDALNEAFGVELFDFIEQNKPDLWIYGHTHGNVSDFNIGKTSLVTNQLGYLKSNEHALFINGKTIEF